MFNFSCIYIVLVDQFLYATNLDIASAQYLLA